MASEKRLVDANAIKYREKDEYCGNGNSLPVRYVFDEDIAELPTVDAVEVVHGRWEKFGYDFRCSACGVYQCGHYTGMTNYCPNCGAKMDGGNEDGR